MARHVKGLISDVRPQEQPEGSYPFAKNGVQHYVKGSTINEPGFLPSPAAIPGVVIGIVETDSTPIFISTNNTDTFIGLYDPVTDVYTQKFTDQAKDFKLNLNTNNYVKGEFQRNYKNQMIVVITDKVQPLYVFNLDETDKIQNLNDVLFFLQSIPPELNATIETGGSLIRGAYYVFARYQRDDGAETAYIVNSAVLPISNESTGIGDKMIQIKVTRMDTRYDKIQFAIISKIDGVLSAVELEPVRMPVDPNAELTYSYTGNEITTPATVTDILVQPAVYRTVGALGQLNDSLYMGDLTTTPDIKWQKYANLLRFKWINERVDVLGQKEDLKKGELKTFMHGEAMAFYARLLLTDGTKTPAFHAPGRAPSPADLAPSTVGAAVGISAPKYQLENTIPSWSPIVPGQSNTGEMGIWINETEFYPNDDEYDSTSVGGEDLRGKQVRHHRFPTLDYTHAGFGNNHGRTELDRLGIQVSNIIIPAEIKDRVAGIEILYAKRTGDNMTVIGQSTIQMSAYSQGKGVGGPIYSTGGNWGSLHKQRGAGGNLNEYDALRLRSDNARFMSFDMLFNKPSVAINYVRPMLRFRYPETKFRADTIFATGMTPDRGGALGYKIDYTSSSVLAPTTPYNNKVLKMSDGKYLPSNTLLERYDNLRQELTYVGNITPFTEMTANYSFQTYNTGRGRDWGAPTDSGKMVYFEETALCSLNTIKPNIYNAFYLQSLVTTSKVHPIDGNPITVFGGDCFLCDYSFNTFGHTNDETPPALGDGFVWAGTRVVRRIVCVAASNINARFKVPGNPASEWYPDSPVLPQTREQFIFRINPGTEPNQFGYSKDLNTLNEISNARPWTPEQDEVIDYPYRIHRGGKVSRTGKIRSWQTLLPLDFYETQKNMGRIINLCGVNDRLLIHHENALFLTQDKAKLDSDIISVTLGSGDIFQFEPQEARYSKLGYAGTRHDLACVLTPMGYVFVDAKQGEVFVWNGELKPLNAGINVFLKKYATVQERNPFIGNGVTIGFDPLYNRLLFTVKNVQLSDPTEEEEVRYDYEETPEYFATLTPGVSLVFKDGRIQRFMGVNQSPYDCPVYTAPVIPDYEFTIPEGSPAGTEVGTLAATGGNPPYNYYFTTANANFIVNVTTGKIVVDLPPVYQAPGFINLTARVTDMQNLSDLGNVKINITKVVKGPKLGNYNFTAPEQQAPRPVGTVEATAGDNPTITYSIQSGNEDGLLTINPTTGLISTTGPLDYYVKNWYSLVVRATDGDSLFAEGNVQVEVTSVPRPPVFQSFTWTILDTHAPSSLIGTGTFPVDPDQQAGEEDVVWELISNDGTGVINIDLETLAVTLAGSAVLDPLIKDKYQIRLRATDGAGMQADAVYIIKVIYNPANHLFNAFGYTCVGGSCPGGSTPSPDGAYCITTLTAPAIPPVGGTPMTATPRSNGAYTNFGTYIYFEGFNVNGTGARVRIPISNPWWINPWPGPPGNTVNGPLNRTGLWQGPVAANELPTNTYIGFSRYITVPTAKLYYIGVAGDNRCRIQLNGVTIVQQDENALATQAGGGIDVAFKEWHVYPVFMQAGPNLFTLQGLNTGGPASFGAEVYNNTPAEITAATSYAALNIVFSTKDWRNGVIDTGQGSYTCSDPTYNPIDIGGGTYQCQKIQRVERTDSTKTITSVQVRNSRYPGRTLVVLPNVAGQFYDGIAVPYYPPVLNSPDCTPPIFVNAPLSASAVKNDCADGFVGSTEIYNVAGAKYTSTVDQAAADAKATTDLVDTRQYHANQVGTCSVDPACTDASEFTVDNYGPVCSAGQIQLVARVLTGKNVKIGTKALIQGKDLDGNVVYSGLTEASTTLGNKLYLCVDQTLIVAAETFVVSSVTC